MNTDDIGYPDIRVYYIESSSSNHSKDHQQFPEKYTHHNDYQSFNEKLNQFPCQDQVQNSPTHTLHFPTETSAVKNSSNNSISPTKEKQELSVGMKLDTKQLYDEMNIRELVNTVRTDMGALIDADRNHSKEQTILSENNELSNSASKSINQNCSTITSITENINLSALKKRKKSKKVKRTEKSKVKPNKTSKSQKSNSSKKTKSKSVQSKTSSKTKKQKVRNTLKPSDAKKSSTKLTSADSTASSTEQSNKLVSTGECNNCCCNFLHYSLRQVMHDAEQIKQFALNTAMIGINPLQLKDPTNTLGPAICIPMYNCENIRDQRFPPGPTFTTISKNELTGKDNHPEKEQPNPMIIQSINTQRGKIQVKLDPQSFGLAPFFSNQYETFIKGPPSSIFFTSYINTFNK